MPDDHATHTEPDKSPRPACTGHHNRLHGLRRHLPRGAPGLLPCACGAGPLCGAPAVPAPELQTSPLSDLEKLQSAQLARIERYGWVDQSKGLLRIPIGRAMEIVASKGAAALEPLEQAPSPQQSAAELAGQAMQKAGGASKGGEQ